MTIDKTIATIITVSFLVMVVPAVLFFRKLPGAELTSAEKELINFSNPTVAMSPPRVQAAFTGLSSPVKALDKKTAATPTPVKPATKGPPPVSSPVPNPAQAASKRLQSGSLSSLPGVSMIYSEGDTKMAIIGGQMLHEGSSFGSFQVLKIEKTKVQIRSAGKNIWLNMD